MNGRKKQKQKWTTGHKKKKSGRNCNKNSNSFHSNSFTAQHSAAVTIQGAQPPNNVENNESEADEKFTVGVQFLELTDEETLTLSTYIYENEK